MIKSMTGYGRCEKQFDEYRITAEIKTVNNRYLDIYTKVYKQYSFIEEIVRSSINKNIHLHQIKRKLNIKNLRLWKISATLSKAIRLHW